MESTELLNKIEKASRIIKKQFSDQGLSGTIASIVSQLDFIKNDMKNSGPDGPSAKKQDVERIILGLQAIREIESQNEELSDMLCDIDYAYKKLHGIKMDA